MAIDTPEPQGHDDKPVIGSSSPSAATRYFVSLGLALAVTLFIFGLFFLGRSTGVLEWIANRAGPVILLAWIPYFGLSYLARRRTKKQRKGQKG